MEANCTFFYVALRLNKTQVVVQPDRDYSTIRREIVNRMVKHLNSDLTTSMAYNANRAQFEIEIDDDQRNELERRVRLETSIKKYISARNADPKPYRWVAKGKDILEKINRAGVKLNKPIYESGTR